MNHTQGIEPFTQNLICRSPSRPAIVSPTTKSAPLPAYLRLTQLIAEVVPVSRATIWRWVKSGSFPAPIKLAERVTVWKLDEVLVWLDARGSPQS